MATIQDEFGRIGTFEDFGGFESSQTISDATVIRVKDLALVAVSGNVTYINTTDESGGVASFNGAGAAGDGTGIYGAPSVASASAPLRMGARFKCASATDLRVWIGWQETVALAEPVNPFTLSGTTLTSNDGGNAVGFYADTGATTNDFRFHASLDGTELTAAVVENSINRATSLGALGDRAGVTFAADEWYTARVEMTPGGGAEGYFGHTSMANTIGVKRITRIAEGTMDSTALYFPILLLLAESTGDALWELDYFWWRGNRDWTA